MNFDKNKNEKKIRETKSHKKKMRTKASIIVFRVILAFILIICFSILGAGIGVYVGIIENAPKLQSISMSPEIHTSIIYSEKTGEEIARLKASENRIYVKLDELPEHVGLAAVAIEDERFYSHNGIDVKSLFRMVYQTLFTSYKQGGSTITQQLIKNNRGIMNNSIVTKIQEQYLAVQYEEDLINELGSKKLAKDYILELYLNIVSFGNGLNGVQTAANFYFEKDAKDLTISESAVIVSITQFPVAHAPNTESGAKENYVRAKTTIDYMLELGYITQEEYDIAYADLQGPVYERIKLSRQTVEQSSSKNSYFVDQIISELVVDLMDKGYTETDSYNIIYNGGLQIYATIDTEVQDVVDKAMLDDSLFNSNDYRIDLKYYYSVEDNITKNVEHFQKAALLRTNDEVEQFINNIRTEIENDNKRVFNEQIVKVPQPQAAFTIMEQSTGKVIAISGGRGEKIANRDLNRATQSLRQQGSVFKILAAFAPAVDFGSATAGTVYDDVPYYYSGGEFVNWYRNPAYRGLSTVREGVRDSMNIIAVKTMENLGIDAAFNYLESFGFTSLVDKEDRNGMIVSDRNLSTALGGITDGVTNLETTAAFATIANDGSYNKPIFYTKVYNHENKLIIDNLPEERRVLKPEAASIVTDMMYDVVYGGGTGSTIRFANNMAVAGKTGTTTSKKDLAFYGYTPYLTAGIWMGYDKSTAMNYSNSEHKVIWRTIMEEVHNVLELEPITTFPLHSNLVPANICIESGDLATELCSRDPRGSRIRTEHYIKGTEPNQYCTMHKEVVYNTTTNAIANPYCPSDQLVTRVGIVRTESYDRSRFVADSVYEINQSNICTVHGPDTAEEININGEDDLNGDGLIDENDTNSIDNDFIGGFGNDNENDNTNEDDTNDNNDLDSNNNNNETNNNETNSDVDSEDLDNTTSNDNPNLDNNNNSNNIETSSNNKVEDTTEPEEPESPPVFIPPFEENNDF